MGDTELNHEVSSDREHHKVGEDDEEKTHQVEDDVDERDDNVLHEDSLANTHSDVKDTETDDRDENGDHDKEENAIEEGDRHKEENAIYEADKDKQDNAIEEGDRDKEENAIDESDQDKEENAIEEGDRDKKDNAIDEGDQDKEENAIEEGDMDKKDNATEEGDRDKEDNAIEEGDQNRTEEHTLLDSDDAGDKDEKKESDTESTKQDGDSHDDNDEVENNTDEHGVPANGQTELHEAETHHQQDKPDLSDEERTRLRHIFDLKAVDGRLDLKGFKIVCRLTGELFSSKETEDMFEDGDKNGDMTISFDEFCRLYSKFRQEEHDRKQAVLASIDKLFPGNDGESVELRKVEQLLMKLQKPDLDTRLSREKSDLGEDDIRQLVRAMDTDGSGRISRHEFVNALCQHIDM